MGASPQPRFAGRNVLVVGGGSDGPARDGEDVAIGNGRAIAMRLAAEGARVAVTDVDLDRARQTINVIGDGLAIAADAGNPDDCRRAVAQTESELGPIDVVVANVAVAGAQPLRAQSKDDWDLAVSVNVEGHWVTAQAALAPMLERGRGVFVFVGSTAGVWSSARSLSYEATKAAQLAVMRHLAVRYGPRGIRANAVVLGVIDSPMVRREFGDLGAGARDAVSPLGRQGTPEEAAAAAAFLASDDASYVNGHALVVDGGVAASWPTPTSPTPPTGA